MSCNMECRNFACEVLKHALCVQKAHAVTMLMVNLGTSEAEKSTDHSVVWKYCNSVTVVFVLFSRMYLVGRIMLSRLKTNARTTIVKIRANDNRLSI